MDITFIGAAQEVTGSCHLVHVNGKTVMLDCGLFQGRRQVAQAKNMKLPVDPATIDAIVLSHAHMDHSGRLPMLAAHGYGRKIWSTPATRDLCALMLQDSARIQQSDAEFLARHHRDATPPLYTTDDAAKATGLLCTVPYAQDFGVIDGVRANYVDAGHILGSASVTVDCEEGGRKRRIVFSGDIGRKGMPIIGDPVPPEGANVVIMESTYGDRDHGPIDASREELARVVREAAAKGGKVLIPAFALGRTQEILYDLRNLQIAGRVPVIPVYVDSPLAISITDVFRLHPEVFDSTEKMIASATKFLDFPLLTYTPTVEESKALNSLHGPAIIVAASGMAEAGRILHHLANGAGDPKNTILIVGYQAENTLGRRIVEKQPMLKIFGQEVPLRARVEVLNGYSAHADRTGLREWLLAVRAKSPALEQVYLVHGEPAAQAALSATLTADGFKVSCPAPHTKVAV
jgi:metallo-beta-lactamase family protein